MAKSASSRSTDYLSPPLLSRYTSRRGKVHCDVGDGADQRQQKEDAGDYPPLPPAGELPPRRLRSRSAVTLGGLAGNLAHGAGFLEALRRSGKLPALIACSAALLPFVYEFLKGGDLRAAFEKGRPKPFGDWTDSNPFFQQIAAAQDLGRSWMRAVGDLLQTDADPGAAREMAPALTASDIGVMLNSYDAEKGRELVLLNPAAGKLISRGYGRAPERPWVEFKPIDEDNLSLALSQHHYGFRELMLREIGAGAGIDRCAVIKPYPDHWLGPMPQSIVELQALRTQAAVNTAYLGEREQLRYRNKDMAVLELPVGEARNWWDAAVESDLIFRSAFWRGQELVKSL